MRFRLGIIHNDHNQVKIDIGSDGLFSQEDLYDTLFTAFSKIYEKDQLMVASIMLSALDILKADNGNKSAILKILGDLKTEVDE